MADRRKRCTFYQSQVAVVPQLKAIAPRDELSIVDLAVAHAGLQAAMDGILGIINQPRAGDEVGEYLDEIMERLYECTEPLIEAAKAFKPKDDTESRQRCAILMRHAMQDDFMPAQIVEMTNDWVLKE